MKLSSYHSITFLGLLTLVLMVLKLTNVINIGWFWVILPVAFPVLFILAWVVWIITIILANNVKRNKRNRGRLNGNN